MDVQVPGRTCWVVYVTVVVVPGVPRVSQQGCDDGDDEYGTGDGFLNPLVGGWVG